MPDPAKGAPCASPKRPFTIGRAFSGLGGPLIDNQWRVRWTIAYWVAYFAAIGASAFGFQAAAAGTAFGTSA